MHYTLLSSFFFLLLLFLLFFIIILHMCNTTDYFVCCISATGCASSKSGRVWERWLWNSERIFQKYGNSNPLR